MLQGAKHAQHNVEIVTPWGNEELLLILVISYHKFLPNSWVLVFRTDLFFACLSLQPSQVANLTTEKLWIKLYHNKNDIIMHEY